MIKKDAQYVIITNNPAVASKYPNESCYIEDSVHKIFCAVRDAVHKGAELISHPLSGSVKPNESPYKSVAINTATGSLDFKSLGIIEDAIATLARLPNKMRNYDESTLEDFRIIDLDLMNHVNI